MTARRDKAQGTTITLHSPPLLNLSPTSASHKSLLKNIFLMEHEIDGWIEQLTQCKQLLEVDVKRLCDKVCG